MAVPAQRARTLGLSFQPNVKTTKSVVVISAEGKQQQQETIIYYQQRHYFVNRILKGNSNTERANTKTAKSREVLDKIYCGLEERVLSIFLFESDWGGGGEYNRRVGREGEGGRQWGRRESNLDRAGRSNNSRGWGGGEGRVRGGGGRCKANTAKKGIVEYLRRTFPDIDPSSALSPHNPGNPQRTESDFHAGGDTSTHVCTCS